MSQRAMSCANAVCDASAGCAKSRSVCANALTSTRAETMKSTDDPSEDATGMRNHEARRRSMRRGARERRSASNENKMSDGGRGRASLGVEVWKSSQKWSAQRSAVRSIAWLGLFIALSSGNVPVLDRRRTSK